jgi:hypothetical protein
MKDLYKLIGLLLFANTAIAQNIGINTTGAMPNPASLLYIVASDNYDGFGVIAIKAIQEQQAIIQTQNEKIQALEKLILEIHQKIK